MRQIFFYLFFISLIFINNITQADSFKFSILNSSNGFPQSSIRAITEDNNGFLWLGTEGGLVRYDGINTTVFRHDINDSNSLSENVIDSLLVDKSNRVWIGTVGNGLSMFDPETSTFHSFDMSVTGDVIRTLSLSRTGDILVGASNGVFLITQDSFTLKSLASASQLKDAFNIDGLWEDTNKTLWIATNHGYLFSHNLDNVKKDEGNKILKQVGGQHASEFTSLTFTRHHGLLISAGKQGLLQIDFDKHTVKPFLEFSFPEKSIIYDIAEGVNHTLWVASNQGLFKLKKDSDSLLFIRSNSNDEHSLSQNDIRSLFISKRQMLWVGTKTKGLNSLNLNQYGFKNIAPYKPIHIPLNLNEQPQKSNLALEENLDDSTIWSIFKDDDDGLWIGTNKGLDYKAHGETSFKIINTLGSGENSLHIDEAMAITEANGLMWIGTYDKGLIAYSPSNNTVVNHYWPNANYEKYRLSGKIVRLLEYDDYRQCLWIGTKENGLNKLDFKTGEVTQYKHLSYDNTTLPHNSIRALYIAPDHRLWIGSGNGLSLFDDISQTFQSLTYSHSSEGLSDEDVRAIYQTGENTLWVGTGNGLNKVSINPLRVSLRLGEKQGLSESTTYTLIPDETGNLWISTLNGLNRFNPDTLEFSNYYAYHGLQDNEFNFNAWHKDNKGNLYFGGINGVTYFNPTDISDANIATKPIILSIDAYNKNLNKIHLKNIVNESIEKENKIRLAADQRRLNFNFSSVEFIDPKLVRYRYRLTGLENDWNHTNVNEQRAVYNNLVKGNYLFQLETINKKGQASPRITIPLSIDAYYWETLWFKAILALLSIVILWGIFTLRERLVRKQAIENDRLQHYRKVVHELTTPLTHVRSLLGRLEKGVNGNELNDTNDLISSSQQNINRSLHFLDQLHSVVKLNSKYVENIQEFLLEELVDEAVMPYLNLNTDKQERIKLTPYNKNCIVRTFEGSIYLVISNLISNALKYSPADSPVLITISIKDKDLIIECLNQGKPIPKTIEDVLYLPHTRFYTSPKIKGLGFGLSIIKQVVDYHEGSIDLGHEKSDTNHFIIRLNNIVI